jgi:predicted acylesterase/phospholipase RssA
MRGYEQGTANDQGYTGINAAYILDQLADLLSEEAKAAGETSPVAEERRERARAIRRYIISQVGPLLKDPNHKWITDQWWYYATLGEAHFGLRNYDEAVQWLSDGQKAAGTVNEWELESCARQLASLARFQNNAAVKTASEFADTDPWTALESAFGADAVARTAFMGKIGLALSGGGFRASLYHLGVLARLAELDVLRSVEVLSCVSGGSIVGAHYYLKVRHLLMTKTEDEISRNDYIKIVHDMIQEFVPVVQQNIRTRVVLNPFRTLEMLWRSTYSRTTRAGELYEECLYSLIKDGGEDSKRWLNQLMIEPLTKGTDGTFNDKDFSPKYQNWRRDAKVPILVLNAATLNTGHTWQFTASWMGESPAGIDSEIDGNDRLRRMYYKDAPAAYQKVRLGAAVGASAAVPGVFEPLTLDNLYPERIVRLVDGGVCDNQGVGSLFEQDCRVMLVSDASGQMESQPASSRGIFGVLLRTNTIFQARIRESEYRDLKGRQRSGLLRGFMFVHLKGDLEVDPVDWINCQDPYDASDDARPASRRGPVTRYGVNKELQTLLSAIRTDLDSFSDVEAYALMVSGYRMTEYQFKYEKCVDGFSEPVRPESWKFLEIEESMKGGSGKDYEYLKKLLSVSGGSVFKVWRIDPLLKYTLRIAIVLALGTVAFLLRKSWTDPLPPVVSLFGTMYLNWAAEGLSNFAKKLPSLTFSQMAARVLAFVNIYLVAQIIVSFVGDQLAKNVIQFVRWKDLIRRIGLTALLCTVGFVAAFLHLYIFDRRFLRLGSLDAVKRKRAQS